MEDHIYGQENQKEIKLRQVLEAEFKALKDQYQKSKKEKYDCVNVIKNLEDTQDLMATRYNRQAVQRSFIPGDKVLVLLPVTGKPLEARFYGPYVVMKKVGMAAFVEILIFFIILGLGLLYAWKKKALKWE